MNTQTKLISFPEGIILKSGDRLDTFDLMVETYGELNDLKTNAVLVCHAFLVITLLQEQKTMLLVGGIKL